MIIYITKKEKISDDDYLVDKTIKVNKMGNFFYEVKDIDGKSCFLYNDYLYFEVDHGNNIWSTGFCSPNKIPEGSVKEWNMLEAELEDIISIDESEYCEAV